MRFIRMSSRYNSKLTTENISFYCALSTMVLFSNYYSKKIVVVV